MRHDVDRKPQNALRMAKLENDLGIKVTYYFRIITKPAKPNKNWTGQNPDPGSSKAPYKIYNIGNNSPVKLSDFIATIENALNKKAKKDLLPIQPGDVPASHADVTDLIDDMRYKPNTSIQEGVNKFIKWYLEFYK